MRQEHPNQLELELHMDHDNDEATQQAEKAAAIKRHIRDNEKAKVIAIAHDQIICPLCNAKLGDDCTRKNGQLRQRLHDQRWLAALDIYRQKQRLKKPS